MPRCPLRRFPGAPSDRASGVSRPLICEIECGRKAPSRETVRKLATALGVEVGDLLDRLGA
jgi:transcriptional regulator with XRE-family HTH domain